MSRKPLDLGDVKLRDWETSPDLACRKVPNFVALPEPTRADLCQACDHMIPCTALGLDVARVWGIPARPDGHTTYGGQTLDRIARAVYR